MFLFTHYLHLLLLIVIYFMLWIVLSNINIFKQINHMVAEIRYPSLLYSQMELEGYRPPPPDILCVPVITFKYWVYKFHVFHINKYHGEEEVIGFWTSYHF